MDDRKDFYVLSKREKNNTIAASTCIINLVRLLKDKCEYDEYLESILNNIIHNATQITETMTTDEVLF